jgi:hypothetical protein
MRKSGFALCEREMNNVTEFVLPTKTGSSASQSGPKINGGINAERTARLCEGAEMKRKSRSLENRTLTTDLVLDWKKLEPGLVKAAHRPPCGTKLCFLTKFQETVPGAG